MLAALTLLGVPRARAQVRDTASAARRDSTMGSLSCPRGGGQTRAWLEVTGIPTDSTTPGSRPAGKILDTIVTLNISDRGWQRDTLSVGVSLGVAGQASAQRWPWHACAGAAATFGRIAVRMHEIHGQIHLRADPAKLAAIGRTSGSTPPAPPRR
jgi:hypothetical protein